MNTLTAIQGHPLAEKLAFSLFVPAISTWLPLSNWPKMVFYLLIASYLLGLIVYAILSLTPSRKLLVAWDQETISTPCGKVDFNDIEKATMIDCGRLTGWELSFQTNIAKRKRSVYLSAATCYEQFINDIDSKVNNLCTCKKLLGSAYEWIVGIEVALIVTGTLRLVLMAIA